MTNFGTMTKNKDIRIGSASLDGEASRQELSDTDYLLLHSSFADFRKLQNKDPMILDSGVVVFVCLGGEGRVVADMHTIRIRRGSFVLLLPYSVIQVLEVSEDIEIVLVATGFGFLEKLVLLQPVEEYVSRILEEPDIQLNEQELEEVRGVYAFVEKQYNEANGPLQQEIRHTLMTFLALEIVSLYASNQPAEKRKPSRHEQVFRRFTLSLARNFRGHRTVEFYAEEACLTPKHFSSVIKRRSGKLPTEWIAERTVTFIRFLLDNSSLSIQEIANELKFPNQSFFTRYFKGHTGSTPTAYRERSDKPSV